MTQAIRNFLADEQGAVTVDWVVLTAAVIGLALAILALTGGGTKQLAGKISSQLSTQSVIE